MGSQGVRRPGTTWSHAREYAPAGAAEPVWARRPQWSDRLCGRLGRPFDRRSSRPALLPGDRGRSTVPVRVDPERKIQVLLGPPGYGKTHLFGRLAHQLRDGVLFIFVPPLQDLHRPLPHIRHHVVMSLFEETQSGRSRLTEILAALCRPSFVEYLSHLPRPLDAQYAELVTRLKTDDEAVWEIVGAVSSLAPFRKVGDSLRANYPSLNGHVVHALALGWSPEKEFACRWLRGESITEDHARRIGLPDDAPDPSTSSRPSRC